MQKPQYLCEKLPKNHLSMQASVLGHSQDMTLKVHQLVSCGHDQDKSSSQSLFYSDINR